VTDTVGAVKDVLEAIAAVVGAAAALWGVCIASRGLATWRDQQDATARRNISAECRLHARQRGPWHDGEPM
jgi:hypothetical protein